MSFHQRLKHERMVKGWTVEQLSQASGFTVNRIAMLERNLVEMVSDSLKEQLAKALQIDLQAPPTPATGVLQEPEVSKPVEAPAPAVPAGPEPLALHLSTALWKTLEAAAHAHGRSLHGEIVSRLEASLQQTSPPACAASVASAMTAPVATDQRRPQDKGVATIQLSEADLAHITEQVAHRLRLPGALRS